MPKDHATIEFDPVALLRLREGARQLGIDLDDAQLSQFSSFGVLLQDWNTRFNLTRVPPQDYATHHFLDSLAVLSVVHIPNSARCIDVGTGAGFPGLPIAIARPDLEMVLLDSTQKKLRFVDTAMVELGLMNVKTVHARAEEAARVAQHRGRYDFVFARAVAPMDRLVDWVMPFLKPAGIAVCLKGPGLDIELAHCNTQLSLAGIACTVHTINIPCADLDRRIAVLSRIPNATARGR